MILNNRDEFGLLLKSLGLNGKGVEIGVDVGLYSQSLLDNTSLSLIYLVDSWKHYSKDIYDDYTNSNQEIQNDKYYKVVNKFLNNPRIRIIRQESLNAVKDVSDCFFDFVYIDANHKYKYVLKDLNAWYPKCKAGGVFAGHDYITKQSKHGDYGVRNAVDEFCRGLNVKVCITGGRRYFPSSWYFIKI